MPLALEDLDSNLENISIEQLFPIKVVAKKIHYLFNLKLTLVNILGEDCILKY